MHRRFVVPLAIVAVSAIGFAGCKKEEKAEAPAPPAPAAQAPAMAPAAPPAASGEALFKQHCAACHPDGGNTINAKKTLRPADMTANNVKTTDDIVKLMRAPGQGMPKFDPATISDADAKSIGDYILATFK